MKNKVLFLVNKDNVIYNFRRELAYALIDKGYEVIINSPYGRKIDCMTERGCIFEDLKIDRRGANPLKDLKLIYDYFKLMRKLKPDVVLAYTSKCSIYGGMICRVMGIPYIINNAGLIESSNYNPIIGHIINILYRIGFKGASCMMFQNARERDYILPLIGNIHYHDIPGSGVNLDYFSFTDYPLNDEKIIFNYVARIVDFKGINELLSCAKIIKQKYPNSEFVLYGDYDDESYRKKVNALEKKGIVKYGGIQMDMRSAISKAHCVIHPSYYEGITNVILEHGAMGRPAIASNIPGCREAIDEGISGYTFELKNVADLVEKVERFILLTPEQKAQMGKAARKKMEREFNRQTVTNIYIEEIETILNQYKDK